MSIKLHSFRERFSAETSLVLSGVLYDSSSSRVNGLLEYITKLLFSNGENENYTPNEWKRCKTTIQKNVEDVKPHSKRVEKM